MTPPENENETMTPTLTPTLTPLLAAALAKAVKLQPEKPAPGKAQRGRATLEVEYDLTVGNPYQQRIAAAVPWQRLLAAALSRLNGVTVESLVREALADETLEPDAARIKAEAAEAVTRLMDATERTCSGKVTGSVRLASVTVEELAG